MEDVNKRGNWGLEVWKLSALAAQIFVSLKLLQNTEYTLKIKHTNCTDAKVIYLYDVNSTMCEQIQLPVS